jgi:Holliday junction resolvase RusA-like endonuclease
VTGRQDGVTVRRDGVAWGSVVAVGAMKPPPALPGTPESAPVAFRPVSAHSERDTVTAPILIAPLTITAYGVPKPKGSLRHIGNGRLKEQLEGSPIWREAVKAAAFVAARTSGWQRLENTPVAVSATLTFERPASAPKRRVTWPITRSSGDVDKQARNILDALVDAGIVKDDSQVIDLSIRKRYCGQHDEALHIPGAMIRVYDLGSNA